MADAVSDAGNTISGFIARVDDEISRVIVRIAESTADRFRKPNGDREISHSFVPADSGEISRSVVPADAEISQSVDLTDEEIIDRFVVLVEPVVRRFVILGACYVGYEWINNHYLLNLIPMIKIICKTLLTTIAAQLEQMKPPERRQRCRSFSKHNYSRTSNLKGLKAIKKTCIGETHIQKTDTGFRQEVDQHQEGTSRAVVPSSRSTGTHV